MVLQKQSPFQFQLISNYKSAHLNQYPPIHGNYITNYLSCFATGKK